MRLRLAIISETFSDAVWQVWRKLRDWVQHVSCRISPRHKAVLRALWKKHKRRFISRYFSYTSKDLEECLKSLGIKAGDTLLLHSSFGIYSAYTGSLQEFIDVFLSVLGPEGNLMMVSLPYQTATYQYLQTLKVFDVRKAVSCMGLISETFRRRQGVLRSLHPTHPVLAFGSKAEWIVAGHEKSLYPCASGTPYEKLALLNGKVLFFDVSFYNFTFFHYLEELVKDRLSFSLYFEMPYDVPVIDAKGRPSIVRTYAYHPDAIRKRRPQILKAQLEKRGLIRKARIGNSRLMLVETDLVISCVQEMAKNRIFFYTST